MTGQSPSRANEHELKITPLNSLHRSLGARMVPFAGYDMPVHFPSGILKEHVSTRCGAGLFDVSHMGQLVVRPRSGRLEDAAHALEKLVPVDVVGLGVGRQRYAFFTNDEGGILDDLMIANRGDHFFLVVNASCKDDDEAHIRRHTESACTIERLEDRALLALQGPKAESVLGRYAKTAAQMRFMDVVDVELLGHDCIVSRSGYTGEDGYEISIPETAAEALATRLLGEPAVSPVGLGARDSLRLEAGLCLYGSDIDTGTTPVEAALEWAIQKSRRRGGARAGGFPGAEVIIRQLEAGAPCRRVGLRPEGRAPIRHGVPLYAFDADTVAIGRVTSGGFGVTAGSPIAMGYVAQWASTEGTVLFAELRGARLPVRVCALPFVQANYKRT